MQSAPRRLLTLYLVFCLAFSPLFPGIASAQAGATTQRLNLPELGGAPTQTATTPEERDHSTHWLLAANTDQGLAPGEGRERIGGTDEAMAYATGALSGAVSGASQRWFSSHGITSALALGAGQGGLKGGSLDVLVPFYNATNSLLFTQLGVRRANTYTEEHRTTTNLGLGYRQDVGDWMLGLNSFYDRDLTGKNDRLGVGLEAWTDFLKLSTNTYQPLSDWKTSPDQLGYAQRPAKGWDMRAEGYLPAYPQLGAKVAYEQYYGKDVGLFSADDRRKDPHALSLGVIYNPVPLVGLNLNHRIGQGDQSDTSANLTLTYRLGEPLAKQLSSDNLMASRMLERMRYDLVSRNNEIVLDHKKDLVELRLEAVISGTENTTVPLQLVGAEALQSLTWTGTAAGFILSKSRAAQTLLHLPAYNRDTTNTYSLQAVGVDRTGRTVSSNLVTVMVLSMGITVAASPGSIEANGSTATTLRATVADAKGEPADAGVTVTWTTTAGKLSGTASTTDANGVATIELTSPTTTGTATVEATANSATHSTTVTFTPGAANKLQLSATPASITADGNSTATLSTTVQDAHGNSVGAGVTVNWSTSAGNLASPTSSTDANGVASNVLTSPTNVGSATVQASTNGAGGSTSITFTAGEPADVVLAATSTSITANGTSTSTLSATVKDAKGNAISGQIVNWTTTAGKLASATSTTDANGVATAVLTSSTTPAIATVQATANKVSNSATVAFEVGAPAAVSLKPSATSITANGTSTATLSATVKDAQGNPISGRAVSWTTSAGALAGSSSLTDANGVASNVLTSPTTVGAATVQASANGASGSTSITFTAGEPADVVLAATSTSITANGTSTSTLSATVKDAKGNAISGQTVNWTTTAGKLASATSTTDANGVATAVLTSSTLAGSATVEASAGTAADSASIYFTADKAATISLTPGASSLTADGVSNTTLTARVADANGNSVGGANINWSTTAGSLNSGTSTTDDKGVATATLVSSTTVGNATVQVSSGAANKATVVSFIAGAPANIGVAAAPAALLADGISRSTLSASLKDAHGNSVGAGITVNWSTSAGVLASQTSLTDSSGVAQVALTSSTTPGVATVQASAGTANGSAKVSFTANDAPAVINLSLSHSVITADGSSTSTLSALVKDFYGNPVPAGQEVTWTTTAGTLNAPKSTTNANGVATTVLTSSTTPAIATVKATVDTLSESATVTFEVGAPAIVSLVPSATSITANGTSTSSLSATVKDAHGNPISDKVVSWTTTAGSLAGSTSTTDANGVATAVLTSSTTPAIAAVQATTNSVSGSTTVTFEVGAPAVVSLVPSATSITANGTSTSTLSATVKDAYGNPISGKAVSWTTTAGALASATATTNANGIATTVLTSSTTPAIARVQATVGTLSESATVTFEVGAPAAVSLTPSAPSITANGTSTSTLTATIKDAYGNAISGASVNWSTSAGTLAGTTSLTDSNGVAAMVLTSSTLAGVATVQASIGTVKATTNISFTAGVARNIELSASAGAIVPNGTSTSTLSATVKDAYGNPVGAGVTVNWSSFASQGANGTLSTGASTTDANGVARTVLTSSKQVSVVYTQARIGTLYSDYVVVNFTASVSLSLSPAGKIAKGSQATLIATVTGPDGKPASGVVVNWESRAPTGVLSSATSTSDSNGRATVSLRNNNTAGSGQSFAEIFGSIPGAPDSLLARLVVELGF